MGYGRLFGCEEARRLACLPVYRWMLDHRAAGLVARLCELASHQAVVLLDYTTCGDVTDLPASLPARRSSRGAPERRPSPDPFLPLADEMREGHPSDTSIPASGRARAESAGG